VTGQSAESFWAPLAERYQRLRERVTIPAGKVDTVFKTAIAACRARTLAHMPLPPGERFDLEYVKGTSWNAYNWYKGNYHSLIQVVTKTLPFVPIQKETSIIIGVYEMIVVLGAVIGAVGSIISVRKYLKV
jgi:hypothetical protein